MGQTYSGVRVVAIQGDQVVVEIDGRKRSLRSANTQWAAVREQGQQGHPDRRWSGHFITDGTINGTSVRMMVDTGATMISMGGGRCPSPRPRRVVGHGGIGDCQW